MGRWHLAIFGQSLDFALKWSEVALSHRHREAVENPAGEEDCHDHRAADQGVPLEEEEEEGM